MKKFLILASLVLSLNACSIEDSKEGQSPNDLNISHQMKKIRNSADRLFYYTWNQDEELNESEKSDLVQIVSDLKNNFHKLKSINNQQANETGFQLILADQNKLLADIEDNLKNDKFDYARWQLKGVTHNCFSCHSRVPSLSDKIDLNLRINNTSFESKLAEVEFLVASRQFNNAENKLYHLAQELSSNDYRKGLAFDSIKLWILLQLRVTDDLQEAASNLSKLVDQSTFDEASKALIRHWAAEIEKLANTQKNSQTDKTSNHNLESVKSILGNLTKYRSEEENNRDLVSSIYASSLLHQMQYEDKSKLNHQKLLALLGVTYSRITIPSLQALSMPYLEQCITITPHTKWSKICFINWKSTFDFNHTGSGGENLENTDYEKLNKLKSLSSKSR